MNTKPSIVPIQAPKNGYFSIKADETIIKLTNVKRFFGRTIALNGISLSVRRGEILGIIGRSGVGKSTLIRCFNGLERPDSGSVEIEGLDITSLDEYRLQPIRRRIGMIFQHFNLLSSKTVEDNIALPLKIEGRGRDKQKEQVAKLLDLVGLSDKAKHYPAQLSGGQKQRVGIARALAANPTILLSDEATSALDPETPQSILTLLKNINRQLGLTIVLITHEMEVVRRIADRVIVLDEGRIVEEGPVWKIFAHPKTETTKSLLQGLIPELPFPLQERLHPTTGDGVFVKVQFSGNSARSPFFTELIKETDISVRLVHGGMDTIQGEPVGTLFLNLSTHDKASLKKALHYLKLKADHLEILGYVSDNA